MTRSILVLIAVAALVSNVAGSGCSSGGGVGDPCVPEQEYQTCFAGFSIDSVDTETKSFQCQTRVCLVNHFQGRVSCPYGQNAGTEDLYMGGAATAVCPDNPGATGGPQYSSPTGSTPFSPCTIPGGNAVLGSGSSNTLNLPATLTQVQVPVLPQIVARNTAAAVYCSCRCENEEGQTNDGAVYCSCPDGFTCTQLVSSVGGTLNAGLSGAYCIKSGTAYNTNAPINTLCSIAGTCCEPGTASCP
jgi:hypothetical protein